MMIGAVADDMGTAAALIDDDGVVQQRLEGAPGVGGLVELVELLRVGGDPRGVCLVLDTPLDALDLPGFPLPLRVMTMVQALTWGEHRFGMGRRHSDLVVVHAGREIEAGLILDGYALPIPARLGHTGVDRTGCWPCRCGRVGCLQGLVDAAILGLAPAASALPASLPQAPSAALSYLGLALIHMINILNPAGVVLGGPLIEATPAALPWLEQAMRTAALAPSRTGLVEVASPHAGPLSSLVGAAAYAQSPERGT